MMRARPQLVPICPQESSQPQSKFFISLLVHKRQILWHCWTDALKPLDYCHSIGIMPNPQNKEEKLKNKVTDPPKTRSKAQEQDITPWRYPMLDAADC